MNLCLRMLAAAQLLVAWLLLSAVGAAADAASYPITNLDYFPERLRPAAQLLGSDPQAALQAVQRLRRTLESDGTFERESPEKALLLEGLCRRALGDQVEALAALQRSLSYRASNSDALFFKGMALRATGKVTEAVATLQEALWFNKFAIANRGYAGYELGSALLAANGPSAQQDARAAFEAAMADAPDFAPPRIQLAQLAVQSGDRQRALTLLQAEALANNQDPSARLATADALLLNVNRGLDHDAIVQARDTAHALLETKLSPELYSHAMQTYFKSLVEGGQLDEAGQVLDRLKKNGAPGADLGALQEQLDVEKQALAAKATPSASPAA